MKYLYGSGWKKSTVLFGTGSGWEKMIVAEIVSLNLVCLIYLYSYIYTIYVITYIYNIRDRRCRVHH